MFNNIEKAVIDAMVECSMNVSMVSRKLMYHRNTIVYHMNQILINTGLDCRNFSDMVKLVKLKEYEESLNKDPESNPVLNTVLISRDKLLDDIKHEDLEFMQQADVQECVTAVINRQEPQKQSRREWYQIGYKDGVKSAAGDSEFVKFLWEHVNPNCMEHWQEQFKNRNIPMVPGKSE